MCFFFSSFQQGIDALCISFAYSIPFPYSEKILKVLIGRVWQWKCQNRGGTIVHYMFRILLYKFSRANGQDL